MTLLLSWKLSLLLLWLYHHDGNSDTPGILPASYVFLCPRCSRLKFVVKFPWRRPPLSLLLRLPPLLHVVLGSLWFVAISTIRMLLQRSPVPLPLSSSFKRIDRAKKTGSIGLLIREAFGGSAMIHVYGSIVQGLRWRECIYERVRMSLWMPVKVCEWASDWLCTSRACIRRPSLTVLLSMFSSSRPPPASRQSIVLQPNDWWPAPLGVRGRTRPQARSSRVPQHLNTAVCPLLWDAVKG